MTLIAVTTTIILTLLKKTKSTHSPRQYSTLVQPCNVIPSGIYKRGDLLGFHFLLLLRKIMLRKFISGCVFCTIFGRRMIKSTLFFASFAVTLKRLTTFVCWYRDRLNHHNSGLQSKLFTKIKKKPVKILSIQY